MKFIFFFFFKASKNSYFTKCWEETTIALKTFWRCPFPPTMPSQDPILLPQFPSKSKFQYYSIQLAFPDDRILGKEIRYKQNKNLNNKMKPKKRLFKEDSPLIKFTKNTYIGRLFGLSSRRKLMQISRSGSGSPDDFSSNTTFGKVFYEYIIFYNLFLVFLFF